MQQLGADIFENNTLNLDNETFEYIFKYIYSPVIGEGVAIYNGYSSDLSKTGDLVCSTGSSAGILFYGDTITHSDGTVETVEYDILPYPVFENGTRLALQRGGGLVVATSETKKEWAACEFLKWLTAPNQNMRFIESTGYLPVTKEAFEVNMAENIDGISDYRIRKVLATVAEMYESYSFFFAPTFEEFDGLSASFKERFLKYMGEAQAEARQGTAPNADAAYLEFIA